MAGHLLWPIVLLVVLRFRGPLQESTQAIIMAKNLGLLGATEVPVWNNLRALSNTARHQPEHIRLPSALRSAIENAVPVRDPLEPVGGVPDPAT
jgi:hypothetical protein